MTGEKIIHKSYISANLIIYAFLIIACVIVLIPSFGNSFFSDDYSWLLRAKENTGKNFGSIFFEPAPYEYFRPVPVIVFSVMWNFFDGGLIYYRFLILVLHIFSTLFLYHLFLSTGYSRKVSVLSAAVFSVMACHSETLYSVYGINEILAALFVFSGLYVFLSDLKFRIVISSFLFLLAVLSRESAFCFIPLILLFNIKSKKQRFLNGVLISLSVTSVYAVLRFISYLNYKQIYYEGNFSILLLNPVIIIYKVFHFFINMVFPVKSIFYITGFEFFETIRNVFVNPGQNILSFAGLVVISAGICVLLIFFLFKISRKNILFPLFVAASGILIYLPLEGTAERFLYLPSAGIALLAGILVTELINKKFKPAYLIIIAVLLIYSFSIFQRAGIWNDASVRTTKFVEYIHTAVNENPGIQNVLLTGVPTIVNGVFFVNQYNFKHIWEYHYPGEQIQFWFYDKPENINIELTIEYSEFMPYP